MAITALPAIVTSRHEAHQPSREPAVTERREIRIRRP
jgi:hypothetical protein